LNLGLIAGAGLHVAMFPLAQLRHIHVGHMVKVFPGETRAEAVGFGLTPGQGVPP
jgi:hypothetical protein